MMTLLDALKNYLRENGYRSGEKIPTEMELAAHFNVSRSRIREATTTLCLQGILDKKARRGTVIRSMDPESAGSDLLFRFSLDNVDPADYLEARKVIERAVMPLTVRRITPVMLRQLENLTEKMEGPATSPEEADLADRESLRQSDASGIRPGSSGAVPGGVPPAVPASRAGQGRRRGAPETCDGVEEFRRSGGCRADRKPHQGVIGGVSRA